MDFLSGNTAEFNLGKLGLRMLRAPKLAHDFVSQGNWQTKGRANRPALTVFTTRTSSHGREGRSLSVRDNEETVKQKREQCPPENGLREPEIWTVKTTETIKLAPRVKQIVVGRIELPKRRVNPELVCVEPAQIPLEGVLVARGLSRAFPKATERPRQRQATTSVTSDDQLSSTQARVYVHVMVANFSHEEIELPKASVLGLAEEISANIFAAINDEGSSPDHSERTCRGVNTVIEDTWFKQYLRDRLGHLNQEEICYASSFGKI
jgi:hypothetical protein